MKGTIKNDKDFTVWQGSYELGLAVYKATKGFPKEEQYGLILQIRKATVSVPPYIAEGHGRKSRAEYIQFLYVAYVSICELETEILLAGDLEYMRECILMKVQEDIGNVKMMLKGLITSFK